MISSKKVEEQPYEPIKSFGAIEIRHYPSARLITYTSPHDDSNGAFRVLAGYIFGGNEAGMKIAMTAPVHMTKSEVGSTMSFVLPQEHWEEDLPTPNNTQINMHYSEPNDIAVIRFSGYANDEIIQEKKARLANVLDSLSINYSNDFTLLGYDPPYKVNNRRNEIMVSIDIKTLP